MRFQRVQPGRFARRTLCFCLLFCFALMLDHHGLEALCFHSRNRPFMRYPQILSQAALGHQRQEAIRTVRLWLALDGENVSEKEEEEDDGHVPSNFYSLGLGKNRPVVKTTDDGVDVTSPPVVMEATQNWIVHEPVKKPPINKNAAMTSLIGKDALLSTSSTSSLPSPTVTRPQTRRVRKMVARDNASQLLRGALWHERHFDKESSESTSTMATSMMTATPATTTTSTTLPPTAITANGDHNAAATVATTSTVTSSTSTTWMGQLGCPPEPTARYPDIDLSVPLSVYNDVASPEHPFVVDVVWDNLRYEAYEEAQREPLLVSFLYSTILNHPSLESSLAFCLANRLSTPGSLISTQLQSLILQALQDSGDFRRKVRADLLAVRDRDPACMSLPHVFLYFKGFQALQAHRVAHIWWTQQPSNPLLNSGQPILSSSMSSAQQQPLQPHRRQVLAHYLQSQVSQTFQIDIHPNATMGSGIMLDHGTGIVIGETARVGDNCSILHHVTLGGSGKKGVDRHPKVGNGVLLGAGSTVLGNVHIGNGCQVGAGTLVITDLPAHCVAVGVPAKIIGQFVDVTEQPSIGMNQMLDSTANMALFATEGI